MKQQSFFVASPPMYTRTPKNEAEETDEKKHFFELADAFAIETIASFFICIISIVHWCNSDEIPANDWSVEFLPAFGLVIILLCIRDTDSWFPDGSWIITLTQFALGIYPTISMPIARIAGQLSGIALCVGVMRTPGFKVADLNHHAELQGDAVFSLNLISAILENIAIIYIVLPLIPALHLQHLKNHKHKQHNQLKEIDRQNQRIALAAVVLGALRWCVWKIFNTETNPSVAFILYLQRAWQKNDIADKHIWQEYACVLGSQAVATILCIVYASYFIKPHRVISHIVAPT